MHIACFKLRKMLALIFHCTGGLEFSQSLFWICFFFIIAKMHVVLGLQFTRVCTVLFLHSWRIKALFVRMQTNNGREYLRQYLNDIDVRHFSIVWYLFLFFFSGQLCLLRIVLINIGNSYKFLLFALSAVSACSAHMCIRNIGFMLHVSVYLNLL